MLLKAQLAPHGEGIKRGQSSGIRPVRATVVIQANARKGDSGLGQDNSSGCSGGDGEKWVALKQYLGRKKK